MTAPGPAQGHYHACDMVAGRRNVAAAFHHEAGPTGVLLECLRRDGGKAFLRKGFVDLSFGRDRLTHPIELDHSASAGLGDEADRDGLARIDPAVALEDIRQRRRVIVSDGLRLEVEERDCSPSARAQMAKDTAERVEAGGRSGEELEELHGGDREVEAVADVE